MTNNVPKYKVKQYIEELEEAIDRWTKICESDSVDEFRVNFNDTHCNLCESRIWRCIDRKDENDCPIAISVHADQCYETPFYMAQESIDEFYNMPTESNKFDAVNDSKKELKFLTDLLNEYRQMLKEN